MVTAPFMRRVVREPLLLLASAWPLILLTPHLPGIPRPSISALPWRQELAAAALLLFPLLHTLVRERRARLSPREADSFPLLPLRAAALFTAWVWLSAAWAEHPYASVHLGSQWAVALVFYSLMTGAAASPRLLRASFVSLAAVVWILAAACAVETWFGAPLTDGNLRSGAKPLLRGSAGFGEIMAVAACLFAGLALHTRRGRAALACAATAVAAWQATLQSLERAPFLGACAGLLVLFSFSALRKNCRPRSAARLALLVAALASVTLLQSARPGGAGGQAVPKRTTVSRLRGGVTNDVNTHARLLFWGVGFEMLRARPLVGVGAGNYEVAFPEARARFSARHPGSPLVALNEQYLTVYAHNEYVQILAEMGAVGFALFALFGLLLAVAFLRALKSRRRPLPAVGAFAGALAFALSSGASASSFRYFGGALVFFFAASLLTRAGSAAPSGAEAPAAPAPSSSATEGLFFPATTSGPAIWPRLAAAGAFALVFVSAAGLGTQAAGTVLCGMAQQSAEAGRAETLYRASLKASPWNPSARFGYGLWLAAQGREAESLPHLRFAVARGFNSSVCYARLAGAEAAAGDALAAERTLAAAVRVYPRSVFLRARRAAALESAGRREEAAVEMAAAFLLDSRAARGWRRLMDEDIDAVAATAGRDPEVATPGELQPSDGVFVVLDENERRFPESARTGWRARMRSVTVR